MAMPSSQKDRGLRLNFAFEIKPDDGVAEQTPRQIIAQHGFKVGKHSWLCSVQLSLNGFYLDRRNRLPTVIHQGFDVAATGLLMDPGVSYDTKLGAFPQKVRACGGHPSRNACHREPCAGLDLTPKLAAVIEVRSNIWVTRVRQLNA